ncbi:MAG: class I SAM-dependent methyltransferase [Anaerolineae bacterium]|nr:class I SAM-dependent methyltransferase [Anaerolineae bacterium]
MTTLKLPGVHVAPNIQTDPELYEIENIAADPAQKIEAAMYSIAPWDDKIVLDLGAGTGFHTPRFHEKAAHVFAVEPHAPSRVLAMRRFAALGLERASVVIGSAEQIFLPDQSIDVMHARFAYFWGAGCEAGLSEVARVMRPGGTAFIIDNDLRNGTFAEWLAQIPKFSQKADAVETFWAEQGFNQVRIPSEWRFQNRADLEAVARLEFGNELGTRLAAGHEGLTIEYHNSLYWKRYGSG